eukprot:TRINITY_DN12803_c0_g2_i6.p1 TRINITY_DN12803_c0_g2~~TRINITY_DN12803_c0_g2_i6.p1  ORF type:complete len:283 (-),score=65.50 TRINITY_DN12803_c0_g2_i6:930-1778(-)
MRKLRESNLGAFTANFTKVFKGSSCTKRSATRRTSHNALQQAKTLSIQQRLGERKSSAKENLAAENREERKSVASSLPAGKRLCGPAKVKQCVYFPSKIMRDNFFKTSFQPYNVDQIMAKTGRVQTKGIIFSKEEYTCNKATNKNEPKCIMLRNIKHEVNSKFNKNCEKSRDDKASTVSIKTISEKEPARKTSILLSTLPLYSAAQPELNSKPIIPHESSKRHFLLITIGINLALNATVSVMPLSLVALKLQIGFVCLTSTATVFSTTASTRPSTKYSTLNA